MSVQRISATLKLLNGEVKKIPTDWTEISLNQYATYLKEIEPLFWESGNGNENFVWLKVLAHFTGISDDDLRDMPMIDLLQASQLLRFITDPLKDFEAFRATFEGMESEFLVIGNETYHFPESLPDIPMTNLPFGEFYDSMDYWQQGEQLLKGKIEVLPKMLALLVKKKDEKPPIDLTKRSVWIEERAKFWGNQNMYQCWIFLFFFLQALQDSKNFIPLYLKAGE